MRILHINDNYKLIGGAEVNTRRQIKLSQKSFEVYYFAFEKNLDGLEIGTNVHIYKENRFRFLRLLYRFTFNYQVYQQLKEYIKKINPDIIHLHNINNKYLLSVLLACRGTKVVQTTHDNGNICITGWCVYGDTKEFCDGFYGLKCIKHKCIPLSWFPLFYTLFKLRDRMMKRHNYRFVCPSKRILELTKKNGFKHAYYLPHFVESGKYVAESEKENFILYVGRLSEEKGVYHLINAMSKVVKENPSIKLKLAGTGSEAENLKKFVDELGLNDNVEFLGLLPLYEVIPYFQKALCLVVPSLWNEQFGIIGVEALACGTPAIASNVGGIPDWCVDGVTGFLIEPGDEAALAEKITKLINNPELSKRLGENGIKHVENNFSEPVHLKKLTEIYQKCLS
jgi:glycosyltransferase involved in cell wall biosynthesis